MYAQLTVAYIRAYHYVVLFMVQTIAIWERRTGIIALLAFAFLLGGPFHPPPSSSFEWDHAADALSKYTFLSSLRDQNQVLFYNLLIRFGLLTRT